jgi:hypothetical protein
MQDLEVISQYLACRNSASLYFVMRCVGIEAVPVEISDVEFKMSKKFMIERLSFGSELLFFIFQVSRTSDYYI